MVDFKKELGKKYDEIVKLGFLKDLEEMVSNEGIISIELEDIKKVLSCDIVGTISEIIDDPNQELKMNRLSNSMPTDCIVNFIGSKDITIVQISEVIENIRKLMSSDINILYGVMVNEGLGNKLKIQALFTHTN